MKPMQVQVKEEDILNLHKYFLKALESGKITRYTDSTKKKGDHRNGF